MPVVVPSSRSTDTVNAVVRREVLSCTIMGSWSSLSRAVVMGTQTRPRPCVTMKLTASGVALSAAITRSPSFSLSSSSTIIRWRPALTSSRACSIVM